MVSNILYRYIYNISLSMFLESWCSIQLASLRDSENSIMSYDEVNDQVAGITVWGKLIEWPRKQDLRKYSIM